jgi:hypothetical protein
MPVHREQRAASGCHLSGGPWPPQRTFTHPSVKKLRVWQSQAGQAWGSVVLRAATPCHSAPQRGATFGHERCSAVRSPTCHLTPPEERTDRIWLRLQQSSRAMEPKCHVPSWRQAVAQRLHSHGIDRAVGLWIKHDARHTACRSDGRTLSRFNQRGTS